ncbi:MAG: urease accessory protein UreE [Nocardioidaceae bacterium]|nr:MAG: urease accessory protein UreE [Nocardioidaceae bacterium]
MERAQIAISDVSRHRLRVVTDAGTECVVALPRGVHLSDGAVLSIEDDRAVVVRVEAREWLRIQAHDVSAALRLGHLAGHLHWRVRFQDQELWVGRDDLGADYLARLSTLLEDGAITILDGGCT